MAKYQTSDLVTYAVGAAVIGILAAVVFSPKPGRKIRTGLSNFFKNLPRRKRQAEEALEKAEEALEAGRDAVGATS